MISADTFCHAIPGRDDYSLDNTTGPGIDGNSNIAVFGDASQTHCAGFKSHCMIRNVFTVKELLAKKVIRGQSGSAALFF